MKRPLGLVALLYGGGLLLAEFFQPPLTVLFSLSLVLAAGALWCRGQRQILILPLIVCTGWTNLVWRTAVISPHDLRLAFGQSAALVTVRGTLIETPSIRVFERDEREAFRTLAQVQVTGVRRESHWEPAFGQVVATTPGKVAKDFFAGQTVEITGVIAPPATPLAEGLFDYRSYLARQGIYYQLKADSTNDWQLTPPIRDRPPLSERFLAWAQPTLARGLPSEDESLRLLWAMTLGWKTALTSEVNEPFMRSGTMHIFAISGLHIALIAGILVSLLRVMQISRGWCGLVVIPLIWFYTAATGWQPSAIRSTVMMTVVISGWALKRPSDLINSLAAAAFIILLWDPQQLFQASFQLSFFVVLSIALLLPPLEKVRDRLLRTDPLLPPELAPRWQRWIGPPARLVATSFATSLAAWLGSLPLTAYYFHLFSPVTLPANLVIVPLSSLALACNLGSLICGGWLPWATELFNHSGWVWMLAMVKFSYWTTTLPGAFFYIPSPAPLTFAVYYILLIGTLSGWLLAPQRRIWAPVALVALTGVYLVRWQSSCAEFRLTVLPLSGGHGVYVDGPGRKDDWLIDCGNTNAVEFVMKPFLRGQGVNRLPRLVLTHGDLRHVGGAESLDELFDTRELYTSPVRFRSPAYRRIVAASPSAAPRRQIINRGIEAGCWEVLHPAAGDNFPQADAAALVLRGTFQGTHVLLLSDLNRAGQRVLLERSSDLRAEIVIAGLPADSEPLSDVLLDAVEPELIIVADSESPAYERASQKLQDRLNQKGIPVVYTRTSGAVTLGFHQNGWELKTMDGQRLRSQIHAKRSQP